MTVAVKPCRLRRSALAGRQPFGRLPNGLVGAFAAAFCLLVAGWGRGEDAAPLPAADGFVAEDRQALADGLFSRGLFDLAAKEYADLVAAQPAPANLDLLLFRLAECQRNRRLAAEALLLYRRIAAEFPKSPYRPRALLQQGLALLDEGQAAAAVDQLSALVDSQPAEAIRGAALYYLGDALEQTGKPAAALARYEQVRRELPAGEFAAYAGLRAAAMLGASTTAEDRTRADALYRELAERPVTPRIGAEALFQAAQMLFNRQAFGESATRYLQLLERFPEDLRARAACRPAAWACHNAGRFAEALKLATAALALPDRTPERAEWLYLKANAERQLDQRREALATYALMLSEFPAAEFTPAARYERILTLYRDGRYAEALEAAERLEQPAEDLVDDLLWLRAESAAALPDPARAVQYYRMLVKERPGSSFAPEALYRLGYLLQQQSAWTEASAHYLALSDKYPTNALAPRALFASGLCLSRAGQADAAIRDWRALEQRYPDHETAPEALYQRAVEELRAGRQAEAATALDELLRRFPQSPRRPEALFWRGSIWHAAGEPEEAARALRLALEAKPAREIEREAMYLLGTVLQQQGKEAEAAVLFQPLLEAPTREKFPPERLAWLAEFQQGRQRYDLAEAAARSLLEVAREPLWQQAAWVLLGRALRAKGDGDGARQAFTRALDLPVNGRFGPEAALRLGEQLLADNEVAAAEVRLRDAAVRAATPEFQGLRAHAYAALARAAEARQDPAAAVRYYLSVAILYDDPVQVPAALDRAATLLGGLGRAEESRTAARELVTRYPESAEAVRWRKTLDQAGQQDTPPVPEAVPLKGPPP